MKQLVVALMLAMPASYAAAQSMESGFEERCLKSVFSDEATVRLHCACVRRQIVETTAFPEDREASFALVGPAETLKDMASHEEMLAALPQPTREAVERVRGTVTTVIVPLCLISAATGKVAPDGTITK